MKIVRRRVAVMITKLGFWPVRRLRYFVCEAFPCPKNLLPDLDISLLARGPIQGPSIQLILVHQMKLQCRNLLSQCFLVLVGWVVNEAIRNERQTSFWSLKQGPKESCRFPAIFWACRFFMTCLGFREKRRCNGLLPEIHHPWQFQFGFSGSHDSRTLPWAKG